ncbi:MAG: DMT family transporter [Oligoflexus sp.]
MYWLWALPLFLGLAAVAQGGLNKRIITYWSLTPTVILNNFTLLMTSVFIYGLAKSFPHYLPATLRIKEPELFAWWYFIPGVLGYSLVAGIPFLIGKIGAGQVFIGLISAQLVGSLLWDHFLESKSLGWREIAGSLIVMSGALLALWPGKSS